MFAKNIKLNMVFQYIDRLNAPERMGKQIMYVRIQRNLSAETVFGEADDKRYAVPPLLLSVYYEKTASLSEKGCACSF